MGEELIWVIAYGSNLDPEQLYKRVGPVEKAVPGNLPGWRLVFDKLAQGRSGVTYANIIPDAQAACPAVAFLFEKRQIKKMDFYEGAPVQYKRCEIEFRPTHGDGPVLAQAWIACEQWTGEGSPTSEYKNRIKRGYEHFELNGSI